MKFIFFLNQRRSRTLNQTKEFLHGFGCLPCEGLKHVLVFCIQFDEIRCLELFAMSLVSLSTIFSEFDPEDCPLDCSRPCQRVCPANAIALDDPKLASTLSYRTNTHGEFKVLL